MATEQYQTCTRCDAPTDKCEEDALLNAEGEPLCEECFDNQPPPDPIEAAVQAITEGTQVWLTDTIGEGMWRVLRNAIRETLHEQFGSALRAEKAMKLLESKQITVEPSLLEFPHGWRATTGRTSPDPWWYASTPEDAVLKAAGEESDGD